MDVMGLSRPEGGRDGVREKGGRARGLQRVWEEGKDRVMMEYERGRKGMCWGIGQGCLWGLGGGREGT